MKKFGDRVKVSKNKITIYYNGYGSKNRNYSELFDFLGDFDIITASEIDVDVIVRSGEVFYFSNLDEFTLKSTSKITLERVCLLENYIDKNNKDHVEFLKWYY